MRSDIVARQGPGPFQEALHLLALYAFAILQPTLDVLRDSPEFFITRQVDGLPFVLTLLLFAMLPPLLLLGLVALAGLLGGARWRRLVHLALVWGLLALLGLYLLDLLLGVSGYAMLVLSPALGMLGAWWYASWQPARSFLTYLAPAPIVFLASFLLLSPTKALVFPDDPPPLAGIDSETPVVMVIFDELPMSSLMNPRGGIDRRRLPSFAELAGDATWFRNTTASSTFTEIAVPAMLSGELPDESAIAVARDHPRNLFTLLGGSHEVIGDEHESRLCPASVCTERPSTIGRMWSVGSALSLLYARIAVPDDLDIRLPAAGSTWGEILRARDPAHAVDPSTASPAELKRHGDAQFQAFLDRIERFDPNRSPPFYFLHSMLPHSPWIFTASGRVHTPYFDAPEGFAPGSPWESDQRLVDQAMQRHLLQVSYVDVLLGRLIRRLRSMGLYDRSLIVITSDHGVGFRADHTQRSLRGGNIADAGLVPLLIKAPGQRRGRTVDTSIQLVDLVPTIVDLLDIEVPWTFEGRSAFEFGGAGRREVVVTGPTGIEVRAPIGSLKRQRDRTVRRRIDRFGRGPLTPAFYAPDGHRALIGRRPGPVREDRAAAEAVIDDVDRYRSVDPGARFVPAIVSGEVRGALPPGASPNVAIGVNGRIAAVGPVSSSDGRARFEVLVPEESLRAGENLIDVYAISGDRRRPVLTALGSTADR